MATVLGAGEVELNKVDAIFLSDLTAAANDTDAKNAGVSLGEIYFCTSLGTSGKPKARLS